MPLKQPDCLALDGIISDFHEHPLIVKDLLPRLCEVLSYSDICVVEHKIKTCGSALGANHLVNLYKARAEDLHPMIKALNDIKMDQLAQKLNPTAVVDQSSVTQLCSMGFSPHQAKCALKINSDIQAAVEWIIANADNLPPGSTSISSRATAPVPRQNTLPTNSGTNTRQQQPRINLPPPTHSGIPSCLPALPPHPPAAAAPKVSQQVVGTETDECTVCMNATVNCVLDTCGHMCMCYECANEQWTTKGECPICRANIRNVIRTYRP